MKKFLLVTTLTALPILSATSVLAQTDELERVKREVYYGPKQEDFSGGSTVTYNVKIPENYGWGKFYVRNDGKANMTLSIERVSDRKQPVLEGSNTNSTGVVTIEPGEAQIIYTEKPTGTGDHSIQVHSGEAKLEGTVTYKYSNDKSLL
ncbi:hypothetical protein [Paenibacillus popilliae]|uniref:Uncharacterized protein n=1 Tax=Paenibacillus popilliae ATCC 14706 TaxID=1212764 RepID=M9LQA7_PAEPP|nr:hypothetical protein [Paenibacillus popilliae]GAC42971.1 hypothetical protein PPOP_2334 [Paenibacillus popilliae ATCC 14706]